MPYTKSGLYYDENGQECRECREYKSFNNFNKSKKTLTKHEYWCRDCRKKYVLKYNEDNKEKIKEKARIYTEAVKLDKKEYDKIYKSSPASYTTFGHQLTVEESPIEGEDGYLLVRCANTSCNKYFVPTIGSVQRRIQGLKGNASGENRLYCSEGCKIQCPIYGQRDYLKGQAPHSHLKRSNIKEFAKLVLERDNYTCQICGSKHKVKVHHKYPFATHWMFENDMWNCITLCKRCHRKEHRKEGNTHKEIKAKSLKIREHLKQKGINLNEVPDWAVDKYLKPSQPQP